MLIIESPNPSFGSELGYRVFLGGGISDCKDWQKYFVDCVLAKCHGIASLYNPRRSGFNFLDPAQSKIQIGWEHEHLDAANVIVFYFPKETLCPITLFELGKYCRDESKQLIVGCDPEYKRRIDVIEQMRLVRPGLEVLGDLETMIEHLISLLNEDK